MEPITNETFKKFKKAHEIAEKRLQECKVLLDKMTTSDFENEPPEVVTAKNSYLIAMHRQGALQDDAFDKAIVEQDPHKQFDIRSVYIDTIRLWLNGIIAQHDAMCIIKHLGLTVKL